MLRRQLIEIGDVARDLLAHAFAARDHVVRSHRAKLTPLFRILRDNFVAIESLKDAEMAFTQARIGDDLMSG